MTKQKIDNFIANIPAIPKTVKECISHLQEGDLTKAAVTASKDPAFVVYLTQMVNKPIFGFKNYVKDIHQIFGILGVEKASQIVNTYYVSLMLPKKWKVFKINNMDFQLLQSNLINDWNKILDFMDYNHINIASIVSLIPATLIVCENIFEDNLEEIKLIKSYQDISYDEILFKLTGFKIFDIFVFICKKWEIDKESIKLIDFFLEKKADDSVLSKLAKYLHLLIFFELSKPKFIEAGLNDIIEFDPDYVADIYENFSDIVGLTL